MKPKIVASDVCVYHGRSYVKFAIHLPDHTIVLLTYMSADAADNLFETLNLGHIDWRRQVKSTPLTPKAKRVRKLLLLTFKPVELNMQAGQSPIIGGNLMAQGEIVTNVELKPAELDAFLAFAGLKSDWRGAFKVVKVPVLPLL